MTRAWIAALALAVTPALTLPVAASTAAPASRTAGEATVSDPAADAPRGADFTSGILSNKRSSVSMIFYVNGLDIGRAQFFKAYLHPDQTDSDVSFTSLRDADGKVRNSLLTSTIAGPSPTRCTGLWSGWQPRRSRIVVVIPQTCLGQFNELTISAEIGFGNSQTAPPADRTRGVTVPFA